MNNTTQISRHSLSSLSGNLLHDIECFDLTNADELIIIYPHGDIYEIFAIRKGDKYEIEFDRDIFLVSLEDAIAMSEIYYNTEDIIAIRYYVSTITNK